MAGIIRGVAGLDPVFAVEHRRLPCVGEAVARPTGWEPTAPVPDVFSWLLAGSRTNLLIVVLTVAVAAVFGLAIVALMVSRHAALSAVSVVVVDALISIPTVLIALILAVPLGPSVAVIVIACGFGYGLNLARVSRPQAMLAARSSYVESALSNGASGLNVLARHILPNISPVLTVQLSLSAGTAVLAESGLTYLGIGVPSGVPVGGTPWPRP